MPLRVGDGEKETTKEVSIRAFRAETYRQVETEKWRAFHEYAKRLLLVSHAALHLMPYLPEGEDVQVFTPERILAEHRAKNIIEGGDGGWKVGMTDDADAVAELAKRDGDEVAAWGMVHARQVAQEKLKEAERLTREPAARERRERLRLNRERAKEERARAKAAADELADVAKESEGQGAGQ